MYKRILIPLDHSTTDNVILDHLRPLAKFTGAHLILVHVADGFGARYQQSLNLEDSEETKEDLAYLKKRASELEGEKFSANTYLATGEPADEILAIAEKEKCDLIAMSTHGHRFLKDFILGSVANNLRHRTSIPILMIRASAKK